MALDVWPESAAAGDAMNGGLSLGTLGRGLFDAKLLKDRDPSRELELRDEDRLAICRIC